MQLPSVWFTNACLLCNLSAFQTSHQLRCAFLSINLNLHVSLTLEKWNIKYSTVFLHQECRKGFYWLILICALVGFLFPISSLIHWIIINSQSMTRFAITEEFFFRHQGTNLSSGENALSPFTWESCQIPALVDTRFNRVYNNVITYMLYSICWVRKEKARVNYYTLVRMAIIKWSANNKCWRGCGEKGTVGGNVNWCTRYAKRVAFF